MRTFRDIIDAFGVPVIAGIFGIDESHVRTMKARDSIPPEYWGALIDQAPGRGVGKLSWEHLRSIRAQRFTRDREVA